MKKNVKRGIVAVLLMATIVIGGIATTAKAIDPPGTEPTSIPNPPTEQM